MTSTTLDPLSVVAPGSLDQGLSGGGRMSALDDQRPTRLVYLALRAALIERLGADAVVESEHGPYKAWDDYHATQLVDRDGTLCLKHHRSAGWGENVSLRHDRWTLRVNAGEYRMPGFPIEYHGDASPLAIEMIGLVGDLLRLPSPPALPAIPRVGRWRSGGAGDAAGLGWGRRKGRRDEQPSD